MKKTAYKILILFLAVIVNVLLYACEPIREQQSRCEPPPEGFSASDLVGTWITTYLDLTSDTLIIKADGTYKQIIHLKDYSLVYETDWLHWWIEFGNDGIPYLHMEQMRMCGYAPDLFSCDQTGGGDEDWKAFNNGYWYDYCHDQPVLMGNEGILLVLGTKYGDQNKPGVELELLVLNPLDSWIYRLQTP